MDFLLRGVMRYPMPPCANSGLLTKQYVLNEQKLRCYPCVVHHLQVGGATLLTFSSNHSNDQYRDCFPNPINRPHLLNHSMDQTIHK